jgi:hypothetical protein
MTFEEFSAKEAPTPGSKDLLARTGALEQWYEFEARAREKALREWCAENSIEVGD